MVRWRPRGDVAAAAATGTDPVHAIGGAATAIQPDPTAAAFFDVDNTIMRGASLFHFMRGLYARDVFDTRAVARAAVAQTRFMFGAEDDDAIAAARAASLAFIEGWRVDDIMRLADEIYTESMESKIWPGTRAIAENHIAQGQRVWLVTAAPVEMAIVIARRLGLTGAMGTVAEHVDGVYTGRLVGDLLHGEAKVDAVLALVEREGLDLARCSAYSDSANDIPMLSLVGNPTAINPDRALKAYAREHGWRIRDYRAKQRTTVAAVGVVGLGAGLGAATAGAVALSRRLRH
jgi:HAD superfamily hydrolase (TIGR01490 family)